MALLTVLVDAERVKMVVVCRSSGYYSTLGMLPKRLDNPEVLC